MRKILFLLIFTTTFLVACNTSILGITEIDIVPSDVKDKIVSDYKIQLIYDGEDTAYLIYLSNRTVSTALVTEGDTLKVKLEEMNKQTDVIQQHVYKLRLDPEHDVIDVLINGKSTPFDNVSALFQ